MVLLNVSSLHCTGSGFSLAADTAKEQTVHSHGGAHSPSGLQGTGVGSGSTGANPNPRGLELEANEH